MTTTWGFAGAKGAARIPRSSRVSTCALARRNTPGQLALGLNRVGGERYEETGVEVPHRSHNPSSRSSRSSSLRRAFARARFAVTMTASYGHLTGHVIAGNTQTCHVRPPTQAILALTERGRDALSGVPLNRRTPPSVANRAKPQPGVKPTAIQTPAIHQDVPGRRGRAEPPCGAVPASVPPARSPTSSSGSATGWTCSARQAPRAP